MQQSTYETIKVQGNHIMEQVSGLIHEGNVRRIVIKQDDKTVAEFPLTVGVVGLVFAPVLAALGAMAALMSECTIEVERISEQKPVAEEEKAKEVATPVA